MSAFTAVLKGTTEYESIKYSVNNKSLPMGITGLSAVHKAHYISSLCCEAEKKALIICPDENTASKLCDDINRFDGGAFMYPARDFHFRSAEGQSREFEQKRIGVLTKILDGECKYVLCSIEAACQFTLPDFELKKRTLDISTDTEITQHEIIRALLCAGYVRCEAVEGTGQFSVRGGIIDIFPPGSESPCRIEFWGDTVDSISLFDVQTQRRTQNLEKIKITPSMEVLFDSPEQMKEKIEQFITTVKGKGSVKAKQSLGEDVEKLSRFIHLSNPDRYLSLAYSELHTDRKSVV